jgi:GNAT superfamily N-acetyltransferase
VRQVREAVATHPAHRRRGYATQIMEAAGRHIDEVIVNTLRAAPPPERRTGKKRPFVDSW